MQSIQTHFNISALQTSWNTLYEMTSLHPIRSESDYDRMTTLMNSLLNVVGENESHTLSSLLDLVSDLVLRYEREHYYIAASEPKEALKFLMDARRLKQEDLSDIVPQSNLSAILTGKRKISATLAGKLGKFFDVSPALFIQT